MIHRRAVRALIITGEREVLLMRIRPPHGGDCFWIAPGGGAEGDETAEATLACRYPRTLFPQRRAGRIARRGGPDRLTGLEHRSPDEAKRNPGAASSADRPDPDCAALHPGYAPMRGGYRAGSFSNDGLPSGRWWKVCLSQV
ncbi:NUDIX hydrolase [Bradyrhizobium elkanii]|uniref:NUDIX hydrolase n=2 Tax=Nitrobacteraceae TaxID=41294 RepID=UPI00289F87C0|nr:NUDIX hydrolase [Bradyrhizobium elkanii]